MTRPWTQGVFWEQASQPVADVLLDELSDDTSDAAPYDDARHEEAGGDRGPEGEYEKEEVD